MIAAGPGLDSTVMTAGRVLTALAAVLVLAGFVAVPTDTVLAKKSVSGRHAYALVVAHSGPRYRHISVEVTATPRQTVKAGWVASCHIGTESWRDTHDRVGRTPFRLGVRSGTTSAGRCTIAADATLQARGKLTLEIRGH